MSGDDSDGRDGEDGDDGLTTTAVIVARRRHVVPGPPRRRAVGSRRGRPCPIARRPGMNNRAGFEGGFV
ncbi:hypothetical protein [Sorangium sp. So ce854]|uniref:hypothetical protein n=1 Tax=Sorangium sp. So ce854 TaxID=3133322 RepID=UPI003F603B54